MQGDILALQAEPCAGTPLLEPVMRAGRRVVPAPTLEVSRRRARDQLRGLPEAVQRLDKREPPYPVEVSAGLRQLAAELDRTAH